MLGACILTCCDTHVGSLCPKAGAYLRVNKWPLPPGRVYGGDWAVLNHLEARVRPNHALKAAALGVVWVLLSRQHLLPLLPHLAKPARCWRQHAVLKLQSIRQLHVLCLHSTNTSAAQQPPPQSACPNQSSTR